MLDLIADLVGRVFDVAVGLVRVVVGAVLHVAAFLGAPVGLGPVATLLALVGLVVVVVLGLDAAAELREREQPEDGR